MERAPPFKSRKENAIISPSNLPREASSKGPTIKNTNHKDY